MSWYLRALALVTCLGLAALAPVPAARAESASFGTENSTVTAELGFDVASGRYGNTATTTTVSVPFSLLYLPTSRIDLGLQIPYIRQSNDYVVGGRPVRSTNQPGPVVGPAPRQTQQDKPVQGVGDLVLSAGYLLFREGDLTPQLRAVAALKIPTADSELGTGAYDESIGLALAKALGPWYFYLNGTYTFQGKTSLFTARDFADGEVGVGYEVIPGLRPSLGLRAATSVESSAGGTMQVETKLVWALSGSLDLKAYLARGLATSAPDWQGGFSLAFNF